MASVPSGITTLRVRFSGVEDSYDSGTYGHLLDSVIFKKREAAYVADVDTDHPSLPNQKAVAIEFRPDGSKLYLIVGRAHILYNTHRIIQYNLSAPWDVRTAVKGSTMALKNSSERLEDSLWTNDLVWNPDGTKLIVLIIVSNSFGNICTELFLEEWYHITELFVFTILNIDFCT